MRWTSLAQTEIISALCELFDKTDTGGVGTISMKEYVAMCDEYGIELTDDHYNLVKSIANDNGEVGHTIISFNLPRKKSAGIVFQGAEGVFPIQT